jgi:signal transduction histidine kinase/CheY-like chemotaxis protein
VRRELREASHRRERAKAERDLAESQALLSLVYDHTAEMLMLFSADKSMTYRITSVNRAWLGFASLLLGRPVSAGDCIGRTLEGALGELRAPAEVAEALREAFVGALSQDRLVTLELPWPSPAKLLHTEQSFIPVKSRGGGASSPAAHLLWSSRNVTERWEGEDQRRRLEAQLMQSQKLEAVGTLASGIAHDFNNLLAGISGYVELVRAETQEIPVVQEHVAQISHGIHRATDLVSRIIAFSRKRTTHRKPIHLGPVVHEVMQFMRPLVPQGIQVHSELPAECPLVAADSGQMHQVVLNLCTNAMQAMTDQGGSGGALTVALGPVRISEELASRHPPLQPGQHVRLMVRDTGCGMGEQVLARLFEPFFTTKPPGIGTGLGLVIVQSILRSHEGAVVVRSQPGAGTTFELYFPVTEEEEGAGTREQAPEARAPAVSATRRILFVDDEDYLVQMGTALLTRLGHQVSAFTDPEKAYAAFAAEPSTYAVLITDLSMPVLRGTDLAQKIKHLRPEMPVVLTTGYSGPRDLERARELGLNRLLEKPYTLEKFVAMLDEVLEEQAKKEQRP